MRVLMLSWEYPPHNVGGLGKHVLDLVPALAQSGVEVHLLTPRWVGGMGEEAVTPAATVYRVEARRCRCPISSLAPGGPMWDWR